MMVLSELNNFFLHILFLFRTGMFVVFVLDDNSWYFFLFELIQLPECFHVFYVIHVYILVQSDYQCQFSFVILSFIDL